MTRLSLANTYHDLPLKKVRKLVGENALDAYPRLDEEALKVVATRVGVRVDEIGTAPTSTSIRLFGTPGRWVSVHSALGADEESSLVISGSDDR